MLLIFVCHSVGKKVSNFFLLFKTNLINVMKYWSFIIKQILIIRKNTMNQFESFDTGHVPSRWDDKISEKKNCIDRLQDRMNKVQQLIRSKHLRQIDDERVRRHSNENQSALSEMTHQINQLKQIQVQFKTQVAELQTTKTSAETQSAMYKRLYEAELKNNQEKTAKIQQLQTLIGYLQSELSQRIQKIQNLTSQENKIKDSNSQIIKEIQELKQNLQQKNLQLQTQILLRNEIQEKLSQKDLQLLQKESQQKQDIDCQYETMKELSENLEKMTHKHQLQLEQYQTIIVQHNSIRADLQLDLQESLITKFHLQQLYQGQIKKNQGLKKQLEDQTNFYQAKVENLQCQIQNLILKNQQGQMLQENQVKNFEEKEKLRQNEQKLRQKESQVQKAQAQILCLKGQNQRLTQQTVELKAKNKLYQKPQTNNARMKVLINWFKSKHFKNRDKIHFMNWAEEYFKQYAAQSVNQAY